MASSYSSMGTSHPYPSRSVFIFLSCFLLAKFSGVRRFFLVFSFLTCEIFDFYLLSCILECVFSCVFFLVCVCVGGRYVVQSAPHTRKKNKESIHSRKQETSSKVENFACQEYKQKEKSSHTGKIRKQKTR